MLNDIRYAFRALRQNPGFALTAIFSIALAIGANSAIFSLNDALLLRPLPVPDASQLVTLRPVAPTVSSSVVNFSTGMSYADFIDFRDKNQSFQGLVAYTLVPAGFARDAKIQPQRRSGFLVSGNFFRVLRVEPQLGRGFRPEEDQVPGRDRVIVLSHELWKQEFAGDPSVIGRSVRLSGSDYTVIGIAPESFTSMDLFVHPAFFIPIMMGPAVFRDEDLLTSRARRMFDVKGRLKPGVSLRTADEEAAVLARSLEQTYPETNRGFGAAVRTEMQVRTDMRPNLVASAGASFGLVGVVLLIACANVANLMLSRGRARAREIAVRLAIGASRLRLFRQLMIESLLIALSGGALGLFVADYTVQVFSTLEVISDVSVRLAYQLDDRVLYFTVIVSALSAVLFGLVPALQATKTDLATTLKAGEHWISAGSDCSDRMRW